MAGGGKELWWEFPSIQGRDRGGSLEAARARRGAGATKELPGKSHRLDVELGHGAHRPGRKISGSHFGSLAPFPQL